MGEAEDAERPSLEAAPVGGVGFADADIVQELTGKTRGVMSGRTVRLSLVARMEKGLPGKEDDDWE